ncbi:MAG: helix-turn-helix domain-containing protein [Caulobacter sp.]|nr:helix-turn-helix domain-containing protein [Caulobacter sp.]
MEKRNYRQSCAVARGSDLLGERWTLLIVRDLLIAPRRFSELQARLQGMGANLLAKRLRALTAAGLVAAPGLDRCYTLTERGSALEPLILELVRWTLGWLEPNGSSQGLHFPDWDLLALKALFRPDAGRPRPLMARFEVDGWIAWVRIDNSTCHIGLGEPPAGPDIEFPCYIPALQRRGDIVGKLPRHLETTANEFLEAFGGA